MFSGIIETTGKIDEIKRKKENIILSITPLKNFDDIKIGSSISINGVCLTVIEIKDNTFKVEATPETLKRSNIKFLKKSSIVNLERALSATSRLDGHIVQGHVDTIGTIKKIKDKKEYYIYTIEFPSKYAPLIVEKGSIALDGISLTITKAFSSSLEVNIIPITYEETSVKRNWKIGYKVNIEFDIIGKYILRYKNLNTKTFEFPDIY